jgi:hypothetical protein
MIEACPPHGSINLRCAMKLRRMSFGKSLLAVALGLSVTGCREDNPPNQGGVVLSGISPQPIFAQIGEGLPLAVEQPGVMPPTAESSPGNSAMPQEPRLPPDSVSPPPRVSPGVEEVIQLARAQMDDAVLLAFIENSPARFNLGAEAILYLHDLGLSTEVIAAMIRHDENLPMPDWETPATPVSEPVAVAEPAEAAPPTAVAVSTGTAPAAGTTVTHNHFYNALAPYGEWMELPEFGWGWRPTVAVVNTSWRPYVHGGRWIFTDCGWYWNSFYSWGWAPFHYGRWHRSGIGWVWFPDTHWGPAWVSWRHCDGFFGWAPLPPGSRFVWGTGMTFHGSRVSFSYGFGLSSSCFTFVSVRHFHSSRPWNHCVPPGSVGPIYNNSTVINNYVQGDGNNTVINVGPGTGAVAAATRTEVRKVKVREIESGEARLVRAESLSRDGTTLNVYRPRLPEQAATPPAEITRRQQELQTRSRAVAGSEAAQAAVVKARDTRPLSPSLATISRTAASPSVAPRIAGDSTTGTRAQPSREPAARPSGNVTAPATAPGARSNPATRSEPQRLTQPTTPRPAWSSPAPRTEPVRPPQTSPAPAAPGTRAEPARTVNPAYSVTPRPSVQLAPRPAPGAPSPASPGTIAPRNSPVPQPASRQAQPGAMRPSVSPSPAPAAPSRSMSAPVPSRAPAPAVVPSRSSGTVAPSPSPSPSRPQSAPSAAPRSSGGTRSR